MREPDLETILMMQINAAISRGVDVTWNDTRLAQVGRFSALTTGGEYLPFDIVELGRGLRKQRLI